MREEGVTQAYCIIWFTNKNSRHLTMSHFKLTYFSFVTCDYFFIFKSASFFIHSVRPIEQIVKLLHSYKEYLHNSLSPNLAVIFVLVLSHSLHSMLYTFLLQTLTHEHTNSKPSIAVTQKISILSEKFGIFKIILLKYREKSISNFLDMPGILVLNG